MLGKMIRKVYEVVQVVRLHSALSKSNMQIHNLRKAGEGRYLVRVSASPKGLSLAKTSPFSGGIMSKVSGKRERMANENKFAEYFTEAMNSTTSYEGMDYRDIDYSTMDEAAIEAYESANNAITAYTEFTADRKITTRKASEWGLRAMLRNLGCDIEDAEMVSDAGYGSQWIAVAFSPA